MELPPAQVTRAVIQRYARLLERYGSDLGARPLILPNGSFFPDEFMGDADSLSLLTLRMQEHAGLVDIPLSCRIVSAGTKETSSGGCGSGACGVPQTGTGVARLVDEGDSWILQVPEAELKHPVALTTNLARSLAFIFLVETQQEGERLEPPVDVTADFIAVALGFGALMLQGSYIYAKSCGGPQVASVTKVGTSELSIAVALFAELGGLKVTGALKALDVTQRAALSEAARLFRNNRRLVDDVRRDPGRVARSEFKLAEPNTILSGVLKRFNKARSPSQELPPIDANMDLDEVESLLIEMPPSSRAGRTDPPPPPIDPEKDELKSMVAEALNESRA